MTRAVQLLHLTDLHLLADPTARLHGWRVARAFTTVLEAAVRRYPDFDALVLGGDLVDDESVAGYQWLDATLRRLHKPVLAIAGNHDNPHRMAEHLRCAGVHTRLALGGWQLHGLNSHRRDSAAGRLDAGSLAALDQALTADTAPAVVFVHHPPIAVGSAWIDAIGLENGIELLALLTHHPQVSALVCGHAHQAQWLHARGLNTWVTPATMRQFLPGAAQFAEDHERAPGYRWLSLNAQGSVTTRVHRVHAARSACG